MYTYKTEILKVGTKFCSDKANEKDAAELDELLNARAAERWELMTYDYRGFRPGIDVSREHSSLLSGKQYNRETDMR